MYCIKLDYINIIFNSIQYHMKYFKRNQKKSIHLHSVQLYYQCVVIIIKYSH